jgi:hypothetical protein
MIARSPELIKFRRRKGNARRLIVLFGTEKRTGDGRADPPIRNANAFSYRAAI